MKLPLTNTISLDSIMKVPKSIPAYQRDFVWEDGLIESYISSLYEAFERQDEYFTGSMVFYESGDTYEIVDGQQRITVVFCIIGEILKYLGISQINDYKVTAASQRDNYIYKSNLRKLGEKRFLLTHRNNEIRKCLEDIGMGENIHKEEENSSILLKNLIQCDEIINDFIKRKIDALGLEKMYEFYNFILEKVNVIHFLAKDISDALLIYSRLNSGGKILGHLEIIKGQLFSSLGNDNSEKWDHIDSLWNEFWIKFKEPIKIGRLGQPKPVMPEASFLSYLFFVEHPDLVINAADKSDAFLPTDKISEFLLNPEIKKELFDHPDQFINILKEFTEKIIKIRSGEHSDEFCSNILKDIALLSQTQTQPLLFILNCFNDPYLFREGISLALKLVFIFTNSVTGSGTTSGVWRALANEVRKNNHLKGIALTNIIKEKIQSRINDHWKNDFIPNFYNLRIDDDSRKIKQILIMAEIAVRINSGIKDKIYYNNFYNKVGNDVDHMNPKTNSDYDDEILQRIGNATLLDYSSNRSLKNKPFEHEDKQKALKNSEHFISKSIVLNEQDITGPANKKSISSFSKINELNLASIKRREEEILNNIEKYFEIT